LSFTDVVGLAAIVSMICDLIMTGLALRSSQGGTVESLDSSLLRQRLKRRSIIIGSLLLFTLGAIAFDYYDRNRNVRSYTPATPCQMRMSPDERERILKFLREHASQRQRVKKIDIVVEQERKDDCLYAEDLKYVFQDKGLWIYFRIRASGDLPRLSWNLCMGRQCGWRVRSTMGLPGCCGSRHYAT
jgi:hypothetical protein